MAPLPGDERRLEVPFCTEVEVAISFGDLRRSDAYSTYNVSFTEEIWESFGLHVSAEEFDWKSTRVRLR